MVISVLFTLLAKKGWDAVLVNTLNEDVNDATRFILRCHALLVAKLSTMEMEDRRSFLDRKRDEDQRAPT